MKRQNYTGEFDEFEVPSHIWINVDEALNEEDRKKRVLIWWKIAGVLVLILGTGAFFTINSFNTKTSLTAKNELGHKVHNYKKNVSDHKNPKKENDSNGVKQANNPDSKNGQVPSQVVPFVNITADGRWGAMGATTYTWTTPTANTTAATICSGSYTVTATNANACSSTFSVVNGSSVNLTVSCGKPPLYFKSARHGFSNTISTNVGMLGQDAYVSGKTQNFGLFDPVKKEKLQLDIGNISEDGEFGGGSVYDAFAENDYL